MSDTNHNNEDVMRAIGRLEGKMDGVDTKIDSMDQRLQGQERRSAALGGSSGGIVAALIMGITKLVGGG